MFGKTRGKVAALVAAFVAAVVSVPVFAALPAAATTAMGALEDDGLALIDAAWIPVSLITVGFILLKLFKRGANKV